MLQLKPPNISNSTQLLSVQQSGSSSTSSSITGQDGQSQDSLMHCIAAARKRRKELAEILDAVS